MGLADLVFWLALLALVIAVIVTIAHGSMNHDSGAGPAVMTAFHDFAPADKQRAMEIVVEEKSGKKWMEQESGKTKDPETESPPPTETVSDTEPGRNTAPLNPPSVAE